jgi:hypothetical protein
MISDFSPLFGLAQLENLYIENNNLRDLSQLYTICKLKKLEKLDLWGLEKPSDVLSEVAKVDFKCNGIISMLINSQMTLLEKELFIHDYLTTITRYHTDYKKKDPDNKRVHTPMGLLFDGLCVCDGYAKTFNILLYKAGIPSLYYTGKSSGQDEVSRHAWNIVTIDGKSYHVDVTWNDIDIENDTYSSNGKILFEHKYFNKSDEEFQKNHEIIVDRGITCSESYPAQHKDKFKAYNIRGSTVDKFSGKLRLTNMKENKTIILSEEVNSFAVHGEYIYYTNYDNYLFRINSDGNDNVKISNYEIYNLNILNERIYYIKSVNSSITALCSNDLYFEDELIISDLKERPNYFTIYNNCLFYSAFNTDTLEKYIKEYQISSGTTYILSGTKPSGFILKKDELTNRYTLSRVFSQNFMIYNDILYYEKANDLNEARSLVRMQLQTTSPGQIYTGSEQIQLYAGDTNIFEIVGEYIYFYDKLNTMRIKYDNKDLTKF